MDFFSLILGDIFLSPLFKTKSMSTKAIIAGLLGGVVSFLLGWLVWGILLHDTMNSYSNMACMRSEDDMNIPLIFVAQIIWGLLFAYIFSKWSTINSFSSGATAGAILSVGISIVVDLMFYATSTMMTSLTVLGIDIGANLVVGAIFGGVIGWWLGRK